MPDETPAQNPENEAPEAGAVTPEGPAEDASSTSQETLKDTGTVSGPPSTSEPPKWGESDINDNDRLMAALAYFLWFLGPLIILASPDMKARPYLQYHAVQALGLNVVLAVASFIVFVLSFVFCCVAILLLIPLGISLYYTYEAYQAKYFKIPIVTTVMMNEGWIKQP